MNINGKEVYHKVFGSGIIIEQNTDTIVIKFVQVIKRFPYPMIFDSMMVCKDSDIQNQIKQLVDIEKKKQEFDHEQKIKEYEDRFIPDVSESTRNNNRQKQMRDSCGIAIKCNFCDGGRTNHNLGFHGVCSDEMIFLNVNTFKRTWCSSEDSACKQYYDKALTRKELNDKYQNDGFVCYESRLFRDWIASAGRFQSESKHDEPMKMINVRANRLCVLTTRYPLSSETERRIIGVFIINDVEQGDDTQEGHVKAHDIFRIELNSIEADEMFFWKYYKNKTQSKTPAWNSGLFRYITDIQSAQILRDIKEIKGGTESENLAYKMLKYFCEKNSIDIKNICKPSGAIDY